MLTIIGLIFLGLIVVASFMTNGQKQGLQDGIKDKVKVPGQVSSAGGWAKDKVIDGMAWGMNMAESGLTTIKRKNQQRKGNLPKDVTLPKKGK